MNSIGRVEVIYKGALVGRLALSDKGQCVFEYDGNWLNSGFSISPFEPAVEDGSISWKTIYRIPSIDYSHIFRVCYALTKDMADMMKVYRLMVLII